MHDLAYGPQLGSRLHLTHTQINLVGLSGHGTSISVIVSLYLLTLSTVGLDGSAPLLGRLVDTRGPPVPMTIAFLTLLIGYSGIRQFYISGLPEGISALSPFGLLMLLLCGLLTGIGANAGLACAINATAKSFPDHAVRLSEFYVHISYV